MIPIAENTIVVVLPGMKNPIINSEITRVRRAPAKIVPKDVKSVFIVRPIIAKITNSPAVIAKTMPM